MYIYSFSNYFITNIQGILNRNAAIGTRRRSFHQRRSGSIPRLPRSWEEAVIPDVTGIVSVFSTLNAPGGREIGQNLAGIAVERSILCGRRSRSGKAPYGTGPKSCWRAPRRRRCRAEGVQRRFFQRPRDLVRRPAFRSWRDKSRQRRVVPSLRRKGSPGLDEPLTPDPGRGSWLRRR